MFDLRKFSRVFDVRRLHPDDADMIVRLLERNELFYQYTDARPLKEEVLADMKIVPPGIERSEKYYVGYFEGDDLIAVLDLIDGYPDEDIAFVGFFMMDTDHQGKQIGSDIITELASYLKEEGKRAMRLAIDDGNPQSSHFWKKNGFEVIDEKDVNGWKKLVAERIL